MFLIYYFPKYNVFTSSVYTGQEFIKFKDQICKIALVDSYNTGPRIIIPSRIL